MWNRLGNSEKCCGRQRSSDGLQVIVAEGTDERRKRPAGRELICEGSQVWSPPPCRKRHEFARAPGGRREALQEVVLIERQRGERDFSGIIDEVNVRPVEEQVEDLDAERDPSALVGRVGDAVRARPSGSSGGPLTDSFDTLLPGTVGISPSLRSVDADSRDTSVDGEGIDGIGERIGGERRFPGPLNRSQRDLAPDPRIAIRERQYRAPSVAPASACEIDPRTATSAVPEAGNPRWAGACATCAALGWSETQARAS
jgi:hypothetical protein